ncbi:MAG: cytochrome c-type biogenesis protein CcmH [Alphaproteobacteria bacterium]|jgi:cytochrome c-type biogenesis protein CcmH|nr:cytochrome c-type biogenesis protein CcmH [Alphaproteobacteria bacterium]
MIRLLATLAFLLLAGPGLAFENDEPLADAEQEARAVALAKELRCLVCQNQSIMESDADLAKDLRLVVREQISEGASDDDVRDYVTARYGDFVLLRPPFKPKTWVLWLGPLLIAGIGVWGLVRSLRRRAAPVAPAGLSDDERARVQRLLDDDPR